MKSLLPVVSALSVISAILARSADITAEQTGTVLHFAIQGQTICDYQMQPGELPAGVDAVFAHGAHLHPICSPGGKLVTGNHPEDHRWHRGVWMAWTKTEFGDSHPDFWNQGKGEGKDKNGDKILAEVRFDKLDKMWSGPDGGGFVSKHLFLDHSHTPDEKVLNETWEVAVAQKTLDGTLTNIIDLTSTQTCAGEKPLKLPKYHYGGLGVRGNLAWNPIEAVTMLTSENHDRKAGDSTKARWVHIGGEVDGTPAGMAVLMHPSNFRFPQPLRLNPKNPQLCIAPSQDGDWAIEPGKPYVSKYRILAFDGKPDAKWIEAQWQSYAK
ncbi:MAG: PmoA family protein [Verrucomicrobiaceae bacterium]|nr:PmoA family protein [Verrucomicrobiaceae bacterium]